MGKFWLRSRISFKESNFGTDKILDAAWKLRSAGRVTDSFSFLTKIHDKLRPIKCRPEITAVGGEKLFAGKQKHTHIPRQIDNTALRWFQQLELKYVYLAFPTL